MSVSMLLLYGFLTDTYVTFECYYISIYGCLHFVSEGGAKSILKFCLTIKIVNFHPRYLCNIVGKMAANPLYSNNGVDD